MILWSLFLISLRKVVANRRDNGLRRWTNWLQGGFGVRPYAWLRPEFVPPSPFLIVKDPLTDASRILVEPHRHPVITVDHFLGFVGHLLPQEPQFDLPITGRDLQEVATAKKSIAGLDGWAWNEVEALSLPWFSGVAILLEMVEFTGVWPQGLLDAYFAMIPKADGDSTPLGQRPLSVLSVVCRLWASLAWSSVGMG